MFGQRYAWMIIGWFSRQWLSIQDHQCSVGQVAEAAQYSITITSLNHDYTDTKGISGQVSYCFFFIIDCKAREITRFVASIHLFFFRPMLCTTRSKGKIKVQCLTRGLAC